MHMWAVGIVFGLMLEGTLQPARSCQQGAPHPPPSCASVQPSQCCVLTWPAPRPPPWTPAACSAERCCSAARKAISQGYSQGWKLGWFRPLGAMRRLSQASLEQAHACWCIECTVAGRPALPRPYLEVEMSDSKGVQVVECAGHLDHHVLAAAAGRNSRERALRAGAGHHTHSYAIAAAGFAWHPKCLELPAWSGFRLPAQPVPLPQPGCCARAPLSCHPASLG